MKKQVILTGMVLLSSAAYSAEFIGIDNDNFNQYLTLNKNQVATQIKESNFVLDKQMTLSNGLIKNKYKQYHKGVPIFGSVLTSSGLTDQQEEWWGNFLSSIQADLPDVTPKFNANAAIQIAKKAQNITDATDLEQATLYIMQNKQSKKAELVYLVSFFVTGDKPQRPHFVINAHDQKILNQWDGLTTKDAKGPGGNEKTGAYYYSRDFGPLVVSNSCEMKTDNVETYNLNGKTSGEVLYKFTCPENTYKQINGAYSPLNDAHYFGSVVFEMYRSWYNISPLRTKLKLRAHYGKNYDNAFWDGQQMTFGDGGESFYPLTSLDVVGHEISHGVTEQNSNLTYQYQSGGINEAFSDMAGEVAKYYMQHQAGKENDWMVGASIMKGPAGAAMRYFKNPSQDGQSIENARDYNDGLDVHYTSGVYNKAFYTLATKANWGIRKAFEVFLVANQTYWTSDATYDSAACGVSKAAADLKYEVADVISSFKVVGVNAGCIKPNPDPDPNPDPNPNPDPDSPELELKNGQILSKLAMTKGLERRYFLQVPSVPYYPYTYKYLIVRLFNDTTAAKDIGELFIRYDYEGVTKTVPLVKSGTNEEMFYIQFPSAGHYHILIKGKKQGLLNLQAYYGN